MPKKILIVDDEKETVSFLEKGLIHRGFKVVTAFDGLQAKEKITAEKPDIVLLDMVMPHMGGMEVLKWLRQEEKSKTPVIIVSAKGEIDDLKEGYDCKADTYLVKPITIDEIVQAITVMFSVQADDGQKT